VLIFPAYLINFIFLLVAGRLLGPHAFSIFYTAISIINILTAPAVISNLFYSKRITVDSLDAGLAGATYHLFRYIRYILIWGGLTSLALIPVITIAGSILGVESHALTLLVPLSILFIFLAESIRAFFQGLKKFWALGGYTLCWVLLRFVLGIAGIMIIGLPWAGVLGILLAALCVFGLTFYLSIKPKVRKSPEFHPQRSESRENRAIITFAASYGLIVLIMYLDMLMGYLALNRSVFGMYSEACIISKSIILLTTPIIQVFFPVIVEQNAQKRIDPKTIAKSFLITFLASSTAALMAGVFAEFICREVLGMTSYNLMMFRVVVASAVPVCLLRILSLLKLAQGHNTHTLLLIPAVILQMVLLDITSENVETFAWGFTLLCWITLLYYGILCLLSKNTRSSDKN